MASWILHIVKIYQSIHWITSVPFILCHLYLNKAEKWKRKSHKINNNNSDIILTICNNNNHNNIHFKIIIIIINMLCKLFLGLEEPFQGSEDHLKFWGHLSGERWAFCNSATQRNSLCTCNFFFNRCCLFLNHRKVPSVLAMALPNLHVIIIIIFLYFNFIWW